MSDTITYVGAPTWQKDGRTNKRMRRVTVDEIRWTPGGGSYSKLSTISDGWVECAEDAPDRAYVIRGRIMQIL